ncbi:hypothetical protein J6590_041521 [Homalodisca vitripennis]|nr:hypothetical protein J6590_041521 [Homalodisca vitripennis]
MVAHSPASERSGFDSGRSKYFLRFNRFLIKDSDGEDVDQSKTCLMFVIRDYIKENYGLVNGQQYIENEQERENYKKMFSQSPDTFYGSFMQPGTSKVTLGASARDIHTSGCE